MLVGTWCRPPPHTHNSYSLQQAEESFYVNGFFKTSLYTIPILHPESEREGRHTEPFLAAAAPTDKNSYIKFLSLSRAPGDRLED